MADHETWRIAGPRCRYHSFVAKNDRVPVREHSGIPEAGPVLGLRYGTWTVISELGKGGMGQVYTVERHNPHLVAALKVLPFGWASDEEKRRFRREQEILAALEHPNIGRFLDAGISAHGEPYLVMEKVEGLPIDVYCRRMELDWRARVRLLIDTCRAVAVAHRQLIVHCDLKPSNVLVRHDGVVKLLDFGLARSLDQQLGTATLQSSFSTWSYSSPEMLAGKGVAAASDVYSLGVLLFELLIEKQLFPAETGGLLTNFEAREKPLPLSRALPEQRRRTLSRGAAEDLDFVLAKALRLDPESRYGSVEELVADLDQLLAGVRVSRRGERGFAMRQFMRRHYFVLSGLVLLLLTAIAATLTLGLQAGALARQRSEALVERHRSEQIASFLLSLLGVIDEGRNARGQIPAAVDLAVWRFEDEFATDEVERAVLAGILGSYYRTNGSSMKAAELHSSAVDTWRHLGQVEEGRLIGDLAGLSLDLGQSQAHQASLRAGKEAWDLALRSGEPRSLMQSALALSLCYMRSRQFSKAVIYMAIADRLAQHLLAAHDPEAENVVYGRWRLAQFAGDFAEQEKALRRLFDLRSQRQNGRIDRISAEYAGELGTLLRTSGRVDEGEFFLLLAAEHMAPQTDPREVARLLQPGDVLIQLAQIESGRGHLKAAIELAARGLERVEQDLPPDHWRRWQAKGIYAALLLQSGHSAEARPMLMEAVEVLEELFGSSAPRVAELKQALNKDAVRRRQENL